MATTFKIDIDHSRLRFRPDTKNIVEKMEADMPAFAAYKSQGETRKQKLYAWIICMYDLHTPLRREIKDYHKRKVYAATLCYIRPTKGTGKYSDWAEKFLTGQDLEVNKLIVAYITSFHSTEYQQLVASMAIQHNALSKIISGDTSKESQAVFDISTNKIKDMTRILYHSGDIDEVLLARKALYKQVSYDLADMRPENVARGMADGDGLPDGFSPHGPDYMPDDIRFIGDDPDIAENDEE